jgi:hypothetical protein
MTLAGTAKTGGQWFKKVVLFVLPLVVFTSWVISLKVFHVARQPGWIEIVVMLLSAGCVVLNPVLKKRSTGAFLALSVVGFLIWIPILLIAALFLSLIVFNDVVAF